VISALSHVLHGSRLPDHDFRNILMIDPTDAERFYDALSAEEHQARAMAATGPLKSPDQSSANRTHPLSELASDSAGERALAYISGQKAKARATRSPICMRSTSASMSARSTADSGFSSSLRTSAICSRARPSSFASMNSAISVTSLPGSPVVQSD
jgi:hypothetical protein